MSTDRLIAIARELGFVRAAIVPIEPPRRHDLYTSWLAAGRAGEMHYLAAPEHVAQRADLRSLLATARALVVVALAYGRADPIPPDALLRGRIARYARGDDYHLVMRDKLVGLADRLARELASRARRGRASTRRPSSSANGRSAAGSVSSRRTRW
jgi:epoxyqueuosine reductase